MKIIKLIGFLSLGLLYAFSSKPSNQFTLSGTTDAADVEKFYLSYSVNDSMIRDTATVANGSFSFSGTLNHPTDAYLYAGELNARDNNRIRRFMLDLADMTVSLSGDDYSKAPVSGSPSTVESDSLDAVIAGIYSMADPYKDIIRNHETTTPALIDSLQRFVLTPMRDSVFHTRLNFVKTHPASFNNLGVMYVLAQDLTYPQIKEIYESWNPEVQAAATLVKHQLNRLAAIQPGQPAPELQGTTPAGKTITLSSLKGKPVLVDFWATWCVPCRKSFPHIKEIYNKYHDRGLEVFCIASDNKNVEGWRKAIIKDGIEPFHHILREFKGEDGKMIDQNDIYNVSYIPSKFLVAADGTMIGRFDNPAELDAKLSELFGE